MGVILFIERNEMSEEMNVNAPVEKEVDINEVRKVRIEKLNELVAKGENPFEITSFERTATAGQILANYDEFEGKEVKIAGRLMSKRIMGKASFGHIMDSDGRMQGYFSRDDMGVDEYQAFKKTDVGDIIGIEGFVFKTKTGEISVHVKKATLLTKSLLPLPEKFHGLRDPELRFRQRYVDLIANPEVKDVFIKRSKIISTIREVLDKKGFIEVETPVLNTLAGGANARPFITHHNTLDIDMYMRIATELHLKRCIVGGFEKVYEIGRQFRNEGMDTKHNPEFTTIELYQAYVDYNEMMNITEELYTAAAERVCGGLDITYQGTPLSLKHRGKDSPWLRRSRNIRDSILTTTPLKNLSPKATQWGSICQKIPRGARLFTVFSTLSSRKNSRAPYLSRTIPSRSVLSLRRNRPILVSLRDLSSSSARARAETLSANSTILSTNALVSSNKCLPKPKVTKKRNPTTKTSAPRSNTVCHPPAVSVSV